MTKLCSHPKGEFLKEGERYEGTDLAAERMRAKVKGGMVFSLFWWLEYG